MNKYVCHYAIVRFLPFVETGEFANVGVVLFCPEKRYFDFKLITRVRRITAFFEQLNADVFRRAKNEFSQEFKRLRDFNTTLTQERHWRIDDPKAAGLFFNEITRPREVLMRFDTQRVVLANDPAVKLKELFEYYVERNFVTHEYQDKLLERKINKVLTEANLARFYKPARIGNDDYHALFPFVHLVDNKPIRVIKPLHLAHDEPMRIFEHGWLWLGKLKKLKAVRMLPENILLPVNGPKHNVHDEREAAYNEIVKKFREENIGVAAVTKIDEIINFARL